MAADPAPAQGEEQGGFELPLACGAVPLPLSIPLAGGCKHPQFFPSFPPPAFPIFRCSP